MLTISNPATNTTTNNNNSQLSQTLQQEFMPLAHVPVQPLQDGVDDDLSVVHMGGPLLD